MKLRLRLRKISEFGQRRPLLFNFFTLQTGGTCSWSAGDSGEAKITIFNVLLCICMVPEIFTSGEDLTLRGETFTGEGQVQIGWWSQENGFKVYSFGEKYTADADVTLYLSRPRRTRRTRPLKPVNCDRPYRKLTKKDHQIALMVS